MGRRSVWFLGAVILASCAGDDPLAVAADDVCTAIDAANDDAGALAAFEELLERGVDGGLDETELDAAVQDRCGPALAAATAGADREQDTAPDEPETATEPEPPVEPEPPTAPDPPAAPEPPVQPPSPGDPEEPAPDPTPAPEQAEEPSAPLGACDRLGWPDEDDAYCQEIIDALDACQREVESDPDWVLGPDGLYEHRQTGEVTNCDV